MDFTRHDAQRRVERLGASHREPGMKLLGIGQHRNLAADTLLEFTRGQEHAPCERRSMGEIMLFELEYRALVPP